MTKIVSALMEDTFWWKERDNKWMWYIYVGNKCDKKNEVVKDKY